MHGVGVKLPSRDDIKKIGGGAAAAPPMHPAQIIDSPSSTLSHPRHHASAITARSLLKAIPTDNTSHSLCSPGPTASSARHVALSSSWSPSLTRMTRRTTASTASRTQAAPGAERYRACAPEASHGAATPCSARMSTACRASRW